MKTKNIFCLLTVLCLFTQGWAQETNGLSISGSVDTYYKYDFSSTGNIGTSFADAQNSISLGMIDILLEKTVGKASFVGEVAFGPRGDQQSLPAGDVNIQNLYVSYALSENVTVTGGYMGTFVGYEIISPTGNFNYSTSYLFTNGPFQNAGLKFDFALTDKIGLMVGVFNQWNVYDADPDLGLNNFGAQLSISPVEGWDAYINFTTEFGPEDGPNNTEIDLTTTFQVNDDFMLGLNAAYYTDGIEEDSRNSSFTGAALYANYSISDMFALGLRYEHFEESEASGILLEGTETSVDAITLSANIGSGPLVLIPEFRTDFSSEDIFVDSDGAATSSAAQFLVAAVYSF